MPSCENLNLSSVMSGEIAPKGGGLAPRLPPGLELVTKPKGRKALKT